MIAWLALLVVGGLSTWTAVPLAWLYIGSRIGEGSGARLVMVLGAIASIVGMVRLLSVVNGRYQDARVRRGFDDTGNFPLEVVLVCSAFAAAAALLAGWMLSAS